MQWTRRPLVRIAALAASAYLVIAYAGERSAWFWIGLGLVVLNLVGILGEARAARRGDERPTTRRPAADGGSGEEIDVRLTDLLDDPAVASAWATAPAQWQQVAHLDDPSGPLGPMDAAELAEYVWLTREPDGPDGPDGPAWRIGLGDEMFPYVDLDAAEDADPVLRILRANPAVAEAWHEDREVYVVRPRHEIDLDRFARLAARALATAQVEASGRPI